MRPVDVIVAGVVAVVLAAASVHADEARSRAETASVVPGNEEAEQAARRINEIYEKTVMPEIERMSGLMSADNGTVRFAPGIRQSSHESEAEGAGEGILAPDDRIYIFMSSSVPEDVWIRYAEDIAALGIGGNAVFVLRGCIDGCGQAMPTVNFIRNILTKGGKLEHGLAAQVWIDPLLFRMYGVSRVPEFVFARDVAPRSRQGSEGWRANLKWPPRTARSEGDWALVYHLSVLHEETGSPALARLIDIMEKPQ